MKIISWNCKAAYSSRSKDEHIVKLNPDIVVVPECENIEEQKFKSLWFGANQKKGLGIFSYSAFELELHDNYNPLFKYVIPIKVNGPRSFDLLAIWAMNDSKDKRKRYIGQVWLAINYYKEMLDKPIIIVGDFNWNTNYKLDSPLYGTFTDVVKILKHKNISSTYHDFYGEKFGEETKPTFFMHHKENKPYHVDYCFASSNFKLKNVEVGAYSDWIKRSDHVPIIITFYEM